MKVEIIWKDNSSIEYEAIKYPKKTADGMFTIEVVDAVHKINIEETKEIIIHG
jgi:hypothetical protein